MIGKLRREWKGELSFDCHIVVPSVVLSVLTVISEVSYIFTRCLVLPQRFFLIGFPR